jgi:hypothetical protein
VRAGYRSKYRNEREQAGAGRNGIRQQRDRVIPGRKLRAHDSRANDNRQQQGRANGVIRRICARTNGEAERFKIDAA